MISWFLEYRTNAPDPRETAETKLLHNKSATLNSYYIFSLELLKVELQYPDFFWGTRQMNLTRMRALEEHRRNISDPHES